MTFLLPYLVFAAVALALLVLYTKPEFVPGSRDKGGPFPVIKTRVPGKPLAEDGSGKPDESASA